MPQLQQVSAACEDPGLDGCNSPGSVCILGADDGVCDDRNNKNYACTKYLPNPLYYCRVRWECTCAAAGSSNEMNCTSKAYNSGTSKSTFKCSKTNDVCIKNTTTIDIDPERNSANEFLAGVKCAAKDSAAAKAASVGGPKDFPQPAAPPCKDDVSKVGVTCTKVVTAFGDVGTQPGAFITRLFSILLAASGAIAILLIMRAGYRIMTARGNPEGIKEGREQLVAAIVGLMFLVFSFVLLQVIGVDLLRLPNAGVNTMTIDAGVNKGDSCDVAGNEPRCLNGLNCVATGAGRAGTCQ